MCASPAPARSCAEISTSASNVGPGEFRWQRIVLPGNRSALPSLSYLFPGPAALGVPSAMSPQPSLAKTGLGATAATSPAPAQPSTTRRETFTGSLTSEVLANGDAV